MQKAHDHLSQRVPSRVVRDTLNPNQVFVSSEVRTADVQVVVVHVSL